MLGWSKSWPNYRDKYKIDMVQVMLEEEKVVEEGNLIEDPNNQEGHIWIRHIIHLHIIPP